MAKKKEEIEGQELTQCTFKPKLIPNLEIDQNMGNRGERFEQLYKIGTSMNLNKKNRKKDEFEWEKNEKFCTYKPSIEK